jgi:hypothetical protein
MTQAIRYEPLNDPEWLDEKTSLLRVAADKFGTAWISDELNALADALDERATALSEKKGRGQ